MSAKITGGGERYQMLEKESSNTPCARGKIMAVGVARPSPPGDTTAPVYGGRRTVMNNARSILDRALECSCESVVLILPR